MWNYRFDQNKEVKAKDIKIGDKILVGSSKDNEREVFEIRIQENRDDRDKNVYKFYTTMGCFASGFPDDIFIVKK